jgi:Tryptophan halogenase.
MNHDRIKSIVIVGGGTAGWMTACALANRFRQCAITLVESTEIGTIGVGEATVPSLKNFLRDLKIDEIDFMRNTQATYKLGICFDGWNTPGGRFFHPFAGYGSRIARIPFQHFWTRLRQHNRAADLDTYCLASQMVAQRRFALPKPNPEVELASFNYAFHFDATQFAAYLGKIARHMGVRHLQARVAHVQQHPDTGFIQQLHLDSGEILAADFYMDCSGFRGLLIEETLRAGYEDWSHWLPCDSAIAVPSDALEDPAPFTHCRAMEAGWQWTIPLQRRTGNGYVYASRYLDHQTAEEQLLQHISGACLQPPKRIGFTTGMRKRSWINNVFSVGLASGFLEPLESTSIYMVQSALETFISHFPTRSCDPVLAQLVNQQLRARQERLRDFLILHYWANQRIGVTFWDDCRRMKIPDSLENRIEAFRHSCRVPVDDLDFFAANSWLAMFAGFGIDARYYHPAVDEFSLDAVTQELAAIAGSIQSAVAALPSHEAFLRRAINADANLHAYASGSPS